MNTEEKMNFFLTGKETVGIAGHVRPDGDCVGSTLAIYNYIKEYYPQIDVRLYLEPIPNVFKFLRYADEIRSDYTDEIVFDLFINSSLFIEILSVLSFIPQSGQPCP